MGMKAVSAGFLVLATALTARGPTSAGEAKPEGAAKAVDRLVGQLRKHPADRSKEDGRHGLYLIGVDGGEATLVAEEPVAGLFHCGSARWSRDGARIYFDATPGTQWDQTHVIALDAGEARPKVTDLGPGNCPSPSPDGKRVAFLLNGGAVPNEVSGVWVMNADGSARHHVGNYGRPFWSPDGRRILISTFDTPCELTMLDAATEQERPALLPGRQVYSVPSWAGDNTLVAALGAEFGDTLALLDATDPDRLTVKDVLWETGKGPDVNPTHPVYSPANGRCVFVSVGPNGAALYSVRKGKSAPPVRLEPDRYDPSLVDLAVSPDGRYVLFCGARGTGKTP